MLYLLLAIGMFIWGQTIFHPYLSGFGYVCYWLVVFGFTLLAMLTALLDILQHSPAATRGLAGYYLQSMTGVDTEPILIGTPVRELRRRTTSGSSIH